jgi:hypothetical protein
MVKAIKEQLQEIQKKFKELFSDLGSKAIVGVIKLGLEELDKRKTEGTL